MKFAIRNSKASAQKRVRLLDSLTTRITQRISNQLARELKEREEKIEQDQLAAAIQKLFHLEETQQTALTTTV